MRSRGALIYQQFCFRITVCCLCVSAIFILLFNLLFLNQTLKPSVWANYLIWNSLIAAFVGGFSGVCRQKRTGHYKKTWPLFAVVFGIDYAFLFKLFAMLINQSGWLSQLAVGFKNMIIILFSSLGCFVASRLVYKINQRSYFIKIFLSFLICYISAIVLTHNTYWWHSSICALGVPSNHNYQLYNFTLVLMASMMSLLTYYLRPHLSLLKSKRLLNKSKIIILELLYFTALLSLALIGIFPYGINPQVNWFHMFLGFFVFFDLGIIMLLAGWLFNKFPKKYIIFNYFVFIVGGLSYFIGFNTTILPFTATEVVTLIVVITWLVGMIKAFTGLSIKVRHQTATLLSWQYNY